MRRTRTILDFQRRKKKVKRCWLPQGELMEYLTTSPPTEWIQPSQVLAICNSELSNPKSSVLQVEIVKILLAKSASGRGGREWSYHRIQSQHWESNGHHPHRHAQAYFQAWARRPLAVWMKLVGSHHPGILYNFFSIFYCGEKPQKAAVKRPVILLEGLMRKKTKPARKFIILLQPPLCHWECKTRALQNMAVWPVY